MYVILVYIHVGSLALCVKHLLIQCIHEELLFVLETLNQRLCSFNYGQADSKDRLSPILPRHLSAEGSLKQSGRRVCGCGYICVNFVHILGLFVACQMWCLGRCLPILIGDLIPEEHPYWNNFLLLLDIVNELFAPVTHPHSISLHNSWRISRRLQRALPQQTIDTEDALYGAYANLDKTVCPSK